MARRSATAAREMHPSDRSLAEAPVQRPSDPAEVAGPKLLTPRHLPDLPQCIRLLPLCRRSPEHTRFSRRRRFPAASSPVLARVHHRQSPESSCCCRVLVFTRVVRISALRPLAYPCGRTSTALSLDANPLIVNPPALLAEARLAAVTNP